MAIQSVPQKYATSDGKEFEDKEKAELHEELVTTHRAYHQSLEAFSKALCKNTLTADGKLFSFSWRESYYYVADGWAGKPSLREVPFLGHNIVLTDYECIVIRHTSHDAGGTHVTDFEISELYSDKRTAQKMLVEKQREWLKKERQVIEEDAAKI